MMVLMNKMLKLLAQSLQEMLLFMNSAEVIDANMMVSGQMMLFVEVKKLYYKTVSIEDGEDIIVILQVNVYSWLAVKLPFKSYK